jgi:hypothetical protein
MKKQFTEDEKWKIWLDYMVTQVGLNTIPLELPMNHKKPEDRVDGKDIVNVYPLAGFFTFKVSGPKYPIRDFDDFCNDPDSSKANTVYGWYFRFKYRIFPELK